MKLVIKEITKSLKKGLQSQATDKILIKDFKKQLAYFFQDTETGESLKEKEGHFDLIIARFLKSAFYKENYQINKKSNNDLVIHHGNSAHNPVGVIIEVKNPQKDKEMISIGNPNAKSLSQLILYYFDEREGKDGKERNLEVMHLIITNGYEWFVFESKEFDNFYNNTKFKNLYKNNKGTKSFYDEAGILIDEIDEEITCTYFNLKAYKEIVAQTNDSRNDELIELYKILSPDHLLHTFANDSNKLNTKFYYELLYILGLEEKQTGGKVIIERQTKLNEGSLIENTIQTIKSSGRYESVNSNLTNEEIENDIYSIALELCITWLNRILFLKLLEGQIKKFHNGNPDYEFMKSIKIKEFDDLNELFFDVLAIVPLARVGTVKDKFANIPYLNSSLFEHTAYEKKYTLISGLKDRFDLPLFHQSVLLNNEQNKGKVTKNTLEYLLEFLNSFNFSSDSRQKSTDENTLINAAVLGLIFEKINGYKDGSFFTPGYITMYMCRETIRRAVVQKFNEKVDSTLKTFDDVKDYCLSIHGKEKRLELNAHINSLKICDPAVGSGHFLVSALNEIIAIKSELNLLLDSNDALLQYRVKVINDELQILNIETDKRFEYHLNEEGYSIDALQNVQVAMFHEKRKLIEDCLFGVDINPKSVMICQLRLWIELLKNAYYKSNNELETLPNIDINIKCGNSLISRYPLDSSIKQIAKTSKWTIFSYQNAVKIYKKSTDKKVKNEINKLINDIKTNYINTIQQRNPILQKFYKLKQEYDYKFPENGLFVREPEQDYGGNKKNRAEEKQRLALELQKVKEQVENEKTFFETNNAFEWRFEFPEILNDDGDFIGFDVVIGNPPYGVQFNSFEKLFLSKIYLTTEDIYTLFIEKGINLIKEKGHVSLIIPIFWLTGEKYYNTRKFIYDYAHFDIGITLPYNIFANAYIDTGIYFLSKTKSNENSFVFEFEPKDKINTEILNSIKFSLLNQDEWSTPNDFKIIINPISRALLRKLNAFNTKIKNVTDSVRGILANKEDYSTNKNKGYEPIFAGKIDRYFIEDKISHFVKYGDNLKEKPSSFDFFTGERILVRRIISRKFRIMATISNRRFVAKKDIYIFKPNQTKYSAKFLLAIINSKLISFIKTRSSASARKDDFTQLTLNDIRQINLPEPNEKIFKQIDELVDKILKKNHQSFEFETTDSENQIDQLVYQLYELTEEEIKIIENEHSK